MIIREYGDSAARVILVQPVGQHELPLIDDEIVQIGQMTDRPFRYLAVQVENWNRDLSPWPAPAVFGDEDFGDGAEALLEEILPLCAEQDKDYIMADIRLRGCLRCGAPAGRVCSAARRRPHRLSGFPDFLHI